MGGLWPQADYRGTPAFNAGDDLSRIVESQNTGFQATVSFALQ